MLKLGIDIGGTFTDFVLNDDDRGILQVGKLLTTPDAPEQAVLDGMRAVLEAANIGPEALATVIHGTTLVTNAVIERKGSRTGLITTRGFRDVLIFRDERKYDMYDFRIDLPAPLAPRALIHEVDERLLSDGTVHRALDEESVRTAARELAAEGAESIAIVFLFSFIDPSHERRAAEIVAEVAPGIDVSLSSDVLPEIREYPRTSTTVVNAYVRPLTRRYLARLERGLEQGGFKGRFYLMLSNGGTGTPETAARYPVRLLESGPAAGVQAAVHFGGMTDTPDLLSFDMGGTTAKLCLVEKGQPSKTASMEAARLDRFKPGSGIPVQIPVVELIEIGAGGGSIARIDDLGLMKVGPESSGADPGPACYGRGGQNATVTDADLLLGYLNPGYFLGGDMKLDLASAESAIERNLAQPGGLSVMDAAYGVHRVVNEQMALAAKMHVLEKGLDPRRYTLVAFGGAGPVHAYGVARILGSPRLLLPLGAGAASALGMLVAPASFDFLRSHKVRLKSCQPERIESLFGELEAEGTTMLQQAGVSEADVVLQRSAEMRYVGQGYEIVVPLPRHGADRAPLDGAALRALFEAEYTRLFGRSSPEVEAEIVTLRLVASSSPTETAVLPFEPGTTSVAQARKGSRPAFFPEAGGIVDTQVLDRYTLPVGVAFPGPAILEERESTAIIGPNTTATADRFGNVLVQLGGPQA